MDNQEKNLDDLRDLLRKKLEATAPAEDGWNVPSGDLWLGLSGELTAGKKSSLPGRTSLWLAAIIATLLVLLLLRECSHIGQVKHLTTELKQVQNSYEQLQRTCDEKTAVGQAEQIQEVSAAQASVPITPSPGKVLSPMAAPGKKAPAYSHVRRMNVVENQDFVADFSTAKKNNHPLPPDALLPEETGKAQPWLLPPPTIPTAFFFPETSEKKPDLRLPEGLKNDKKEKLFIGHAYAGVSRTGNRLSGEKPSIIANQKALMGWQTGIGLEAVFSRHWSFETGLRYGIHRIQTDYELAVPYTHNGEFLHDDGNFDNQYNHSLPSSLGDYPLQLLLTRDNTASVEEGEEMRLDVNIRQRIRQLSLPLHLRYGLGKYRWQAGIRAGFVANHTLAVEAEGNPGFLSHHGAIHQRHTVVGNPSIGDLQKFTFDASLGLDLRYRVSPVFGLSLGGSWQRALTPVHEGENVRNYLEAFGVNMGVQIGLR